ncbi:hypothetical protein LJC40_02805 [Synergistaceae bacterium OttesenSCG-928-D05]|nr:hypothetical protein [Synergistaceae bacterium OttesenSCG-928-D05]
MKKFYFNTPILVGGTWYNRDGSVERVKENTQARFTPSATDYAKAVTLNNKIIAALFSAVAIVAIAYKVL